ncbi:MAG TPA: redoxin domain-containing protein, partial [Nitrosopumilaceae archaeon]|nr:redoxin domain-containing protein [Nitrosopumilaceae archaeon]
MSISFAVLADEIKIGSKVPDIVLKNSQGETISLSSVNKNKVVLLHFWAPSVINSRSNHSGMNALSEEYKNIGLNGAEGFVIYAVGLEKLKESWEMAIQKDQFT